MASILRVATYSRVSTFHDQDPAVQTAELNKYCEARSWEVTEQIVDHGYSGGTDQRPGLKSLLALARAKQIDVVVVVKLDRLARSLRHLVALLDEVTALGVQFVSIKDQIDLTTASGRLMTHILGAFAEFERSLIRERTLAGLAFARSKGKRLGRPRTCDYEAILELRSKGLSYSAIQRRLGISRPSIHRAITLNSTNTSLIIVNKPGKSREQK